MGAMKNLYERLGASATKGDVHAAIRAEDKGLYPRAFCKILPDPFDRDFASVIHADGAGTKSLLAYLYYKETGDARYFQNPAQDSIVMNIDDMACVGAVDNFLMSNQIDRNAHRIGPDALEQIISGYRAFARQMKKFGVNILSGGGETADVGDLVQTCVINSTFCTRIKRSKLVTFDKVRAGDLIVGLSSSGRAKYENRENSGIGSNGLTAARHMLLNKKYAKKYPEIVSQTLNEGGYEGAFSLGDKLPKSGLSVGEALISPSRTYVPVIRDLLNTDFEDIHGLVHCTGGGLVKSKNFGRRLRYVKENLFPMPAVFRALEETGKMSAGEMNKVFNMGHRLEVYTPPTHAMTVVETAKKYGIEARVLGQIDGSPDGKNHVVVVRDGKTYEY